MVRSKQQQDDVQMWRMCQTRWPRVIGIVWTFWDDFLYVPAFFRTVLLCSKSILLYGSSTTDLMTAFWLFKKPDAVRNLWRKSIVDDGTSRLPKEYIWIIKLFLSFSIEKQKQNPSKFLSALQTLCPHLRVDLLSYDSRLTLICLDGWQNSEGNNDDDDDAMGWTRNSSDSCAHSSWQGR